MIKLNNKGWEFPEESNWPCAVAFTLGDPPDPVTRNEALSQASMIAAGPEMLKALRYISALPTESGASPELCRAVAVAIDAIAKVNEENQ